MASIKTVKVTAEGPNGWVVTAHSGKHVSIVDQPEAMGGTDSGPTPLDYIFVALGSCLVTVSKIVAGQQKIDLRGVEVEVSGDLNLDVLRGIEKNERAGFTSITAKVKVDADLTKEEKEAFLEEVDKRCPVSDNLMHLTQVTVNLSE
ncbi:MAG: OsmC family protein [Anaerolineaceae bacterium]|nr:OsmC family protein [Anaerolineaceae bacterium]